MQEEKWYFLQPELPPIPEQQMEVHNRIEPLRGFLHLWPTPWTFSFFLQWQSLSSWPSSTGLLELMCRCPLSPLKPATRHVDPPGSAEIPDPEGREKAPESSRQVRRGTVSGFWPLITSAWAGRRWHVSVHELWQKERWARRGVHYRRHSGCCAWHCHLPTRSGSWTAGSCLQVRALTSGGLSRMTPHLQSQGPFTPTQGFLILCVSLHGLSFHPHFNRSCRLLEPEFSVTRVQDENRNNLLLALLSSVTVC